MTKQFLRFSFAILTVFLFSVSFIKAQARADAYAITNAQIITVSGKIIPKGAIVVRNGLIESVGAAVKIPSDARVIDGNNLTIYPGFFDTLTKLGLPTVAPAPRGQGAPQAPQTQTPSNSNYPDGLRPELTAEENLRAGEAQFEAQRNAGFTTVLTIGGDDIFNGQSAVINLAGENVSAMIVKTPFAQHVSFNTLRSGQYPTSLMGTFSALRQMFLDAQRLAEIQKLYAANPRGVKRPESDASLEALLPVLSGQMPIVFNANTEREILRALDFAKEFKLRPIIAGGQESWKVADRLKLENVPVLLSLDFPKRTAAASAEADPEPLSLLRLRAETPSAAVRLQNEGVKFAFQSGAMKNIGDFLTNAGKAVESGLNKDAAIRAMTLSAAEILGVNNQLGSIEEGKIANLVVMRGDIFGKDRTITHVFVDGKLFEQKDKPKTPPNATTQPGTAPNISGTYSVTLQIPGQPLPATMVLTQQGSTLTGTLQSQLGTAPIRNGGVTADGFSYNATVEFQGSSIEIFVKGSVTGNQISGTVDSPQGAIPFSGTKTP